MKPRLVLAVLLAALLPAGAARADPAPFDLRGPGLRVSVKHGEATLPLSRVPNLSAGDRLSIAAVLPPDQEAHYLMVAAFLRGATNPPPKKWFFRAETWKRKKNGLDIVVPEGARQLVLFLAPSTGGDFDALVDAVRGQPGAFVRASQDLNQASLDRARLDHFVDAIRLQERQNPEQLDTMSPVLARSLAIKLTEDCLSRPTQLQAACLTQGRDSLVLADSHSRSLTETLAGTTADLALQLSATPEGGYGYYSPYIGVVRDLARIFGAFQSTHFQYIPALTQFQGDRVGLLLNAAPSFSKPMSALVVALPAVEPAEAPPLRPVRPDGAFCATAPGLVFPVEGAPLVYATGYAHDMALRVRKAGGGEVDLPVTPAPERGGYMLGAGDLPLAELGGEVDATLHGRWGFLSFEGPRFRLPNPRQASWRIAPAGAGTLDLLGGAAACVDGLSLRQASGTRPLEWKASAPDHLVVTLPRGRAPAADAALLVSQRGLGEPQALSLASVTETARPVVDLVSKSIIRRPSAGRLAITTPDEDALFQDERLTFSIRGNGATRFTGREQVEVATADGRATTTIDAANGLSLQDESVAIATLDPGKALGPSAFGPLRFRLVQNDVPGNWTPLATLVRRPVLDALSCPDGDGPCALTGASLFLIDAVAGDPGLANPVTVPAGFTDTMLTVPRPANGTLYLRLRDSRDIIATLHAMP